jgi:hypothetical protein
MFTGRMERSRDRGWRDDFRDRDRSREDVAGPTVPLTEENLARQQLREAESSIHVYKDDSNKAVTLDTSPSVGSEENVTIRVPGNVRIVVGSEQIECNDGGVIRVGRALNGLRNESNLERRSRVERRRRPRSRRSS